eukprot:m.57565 g.57565  ORF g.57565 m.57565 type:complete len:215 (+) comp7089_c0_seq1:42-686(+)
MADELAEKLARRAKINSGEDVAPIERKVYNVYTEFPEFSRKEIKEKEKMFKQYDTGGDGYIDLQELKLMMEKLGAPQTHVALKSMIKEVDEDYDGQMSFREFLLIFRKAAAGELVCDGLSVIADSVDVTEVGVKGAKGFFDGLAARQASSNKFEEEIRQEQEERKREAEEAWESKRDERVQSWRDFEVQAKKKKKKNKTTLGFLKPPKLKTEAR